MKIIDFDIKKKRHEKITMVTCYDFWSAKIIAETNIDCILVGDTLTMVMHGHETTLPATVDLIALHIQAVARGVKNKFIIGDLPFLSYRKGLDSNMAAVEKLMQAGAQAVKLEGSYGNIEFIRHVVESGVPVMGHIGLTPQSIYQLGGMKVQGKNAEAAQDLLKQAKLLEEAGCFGIVLECVPSLLAQTITESLVIPTIGIGAGPHTSGQVLVFHDLLGFNQAFKPKFLKEYLPGAKMIKDALNLYHQEVSQGIFPDVVEHSYT